MHSSIIATLIAAGRSTEGAAPVQSITVYPEYSHPTSGTPTLSGYRATQSFDITIRSASSVGAVVDAIV